MERVFMYCPVSGKTKKEYVEWEKVSLRDSLFHPNDKHKEDRIAFIKKFIERCKLPYQANKGKTKYQVIMLYPSKLLIVMGTGLSVAMLNDTKIADIEKQATKIDITHEMIEGFAKRKGAWIMYAERILNDSKKCK